jgi:hypothetical protein
MAYDGVTTVAAMQDIAVHSARAKSATAHALPQQYSIGSEAAHVHSVQSASTCAVRDHQFRCMSGVCISSTHLVLCRYVLASLKDYHYDAPE